MKGSALVISIDEYKKTIPGYDPGEAHLVHRESAKLADKAFDRALKSGKYSKAILLSGRQNRIHRLLSDSRECSYL